MKKIIGLAVLAAGLLFGGKAVAQGFGLLTFSATQQYLPGTEVMRPASLTPNFSVDFASIGPYINLTGVTGTDPSTDTANWYYPFGAPTAPSNFGPGFCSGTEICGAAANFSVSGGNPGNMSCFPTNGIKTGSGSSASLICDGPIAAYGTASATQSFSTLNFVVSPAVPSSPSGQSIEIIFGDLTTDNALGFCSISAGGTSCSGSLSGSVTAGDHIIVGARLFVPTSATYNVTNATWNVQ